MPLSLQWAPFLSFRTSLASRDRMCTGQGMWTQEKSRRARTLSSLGRVLTGGETALGLARQGKTVTVVEMLGKEALGRDGSPIAITGLFELLKESGVKIVTNTRMQAMTNCGVKTIDTALEKMNTRRIPSSWQPA